MLETERSSKSVSPEVGISALSLDIDLNSAIARPEDETVFGLDLAKIIGIVLARDES